MGHLSSIILLLVWTCGFAHGTPVADVTYEELEELDATCNTLDNCKLPRDSDTLEKYTCHCGSFCSRLNTCCIDSLYRNEKPTVSAPTSSCRSVSGAHSSNYFIIDKCPSNAVDSIWGRLCGDEKDDDLMSSVPVTSIYTNLTYKNYFCYSCHEAGHAYRYWNIKLSANLKPNEEMQSNVKLSYNKNDHTWLAPIGEGGDLVPVTLATEIPEDIKGLPKLCVSDVISKCSEYWQDDIVRQKCYAYTSIVYFLSNEQTITYKNPHCALCNFEDLEKMNCALKTFVRITSKKPFSFTYLLDINRSDGDKVGEIQPCDENSIWDPFFKKCRVLNCALPGYVVKNGKCSPS